MFDKELKNKINRLLVKQTKTLAEVVYSWTHDKTQTDEIVSGTWVRSFRHIEQLNKLENLNPFLIAIARNILNEKKRAEFEMVEVPLVELPWSSDQDIQRQVEGKRSLSQRLYGIIKFDDGPPNDKEAKDMIADYLHRKYS